MDISKLQIGTPIKIKTEDDIYDSYISAITIKDENYIYFKSGSLRVTLLDKLKKDNNNVGNKFDVSGGVIKGNVNIKGQIFQNGKELKPIELYYDNTASYVSGTLTDDITNYDIITVIGQSTDGHQCSTTIYKPYNGAKISLCAPQNSGTDSYNKYAVYEFTSTTVIQSNKNFQIANNNTSNGNFIKLKAVLGYKL